MKKRIFIEAHYLEIGGAEISLIGLLNAIDYTEYDVDLFLYSHRGELLNYVPSNVNLLPEIPEYAQMEVPIIETLKKGYWKQGLARIKAKLQYLFWAKRNQPTTPDAYFQFLDNAIMPTLPSLYAYGEYDLAVNFIALRNHIPTKVLARKTITWIHTDLTSISVNPKLELLSWAKYDYIASISQSATNAFKKIFPQLDGKIVEIENILSPEYVRSRSAEYDAVKELSSYGGDVSLLSIGRFCFAKNYDNVPDICRRIVENGINVRWFIIGFGADEVIIRDKIKEAHMEKHVIVLGKRNNPYPYIKACDIYVQPSRYEGKSVTVREAQILCKPVVITNFATAESQVNNGVDGVIVPLENNACAKGIMDIIRSPRIQGELINNCMNTEFGNTSEVDKLVDLINK